ncbi:proteasome subunit beta type-7 isoform X1 [Drosophila takahashii]|uniref:proteasome subunit beta type-7 isoform X1 n=2 Tax=Drosophila takahashii TaxID=29030 RepID=UPI001CF90D34|nr:proteasome subunit beta type-7 [Drosophila takahashii]
MLFPFSAPKAAQEKSVDISGMRCGFNFVNCRRNAELLAQGYEPPKAIRTGTSIVGIIYKDGVILGADTRATEGPIVSDKNCSKIHHLQNHIYCCGAGTAADTEMMTLMTSSELDMHQLNTGRQVPVVCASMLLRRTLFRYQGHIGAALVMGGVDRTGPQIYCIYPCGSNDKIPYAAMGSGTLAAMSVLEHGWRPDLDREQGKQLVREAISAGVFNDLGSGSNIDLCVITRKGAEYLRTDTIASEKGERLGKYGIRPNTTMVTSTSVLSLLVTDERTYGVGSFPSQFSVVADQDQQPGTSGVQGGNPSKEEEEEDLPGGSQKKSL